MHLWKYSRLAFMVLAGAGMMVAPAPARSQEPSTMQYTVIRLLAHEIIPPLATISEGTVIIWLNEAPETVEIQFTNHDMSAACNNAPPSLNKTKQDLAFQIPFGKVESICLVQKGEFNYSVKRGSQRMTGMICVK